MLFACDGRSPLPRPQVSSDRVYAMGSFFLRLPLSVGHLMSPRQIIVVC